MISYKTIISEYSKMSENHKKEFVEVMVNIIICLKYYLLKIIYDLRAAELEKMIKGEGTNVTSANN